MDITVNHTRINVSINDPGATRVTVRRASVIVATVAKQGPPGQSMMVQGGSSGQVLAKGSDGDGDFVWVNIDRTVIITGTGEPPPAEGLPDGTIYIRYQ
jgi:hypothetical protein